MTREKQKRSESVTHFDQTSDLVIVIRTDISLIKFVINLIVLAATIMKWALLLWMDKTTSILPISAIMRENNKVIVRAKFDDGNYYKAKVLAESSK